MQTKKTAIMLVALAIVSTQCCTYHKKNKSRSLATALALGQFGSLQEAADAARTRAGTKSISVAIIRHDGTMETAVSNAADGTNPVAADTRFSIGSCTKTFIAASIFRLIELKKLGLDDTLGELLYDTLVLDESLKTRIGPGIRIRDLLGHRTGIDDYLGASYYSAIYGNPDERWDYNKTLSYVDSPVYDYDSANPANNKFYYSNTNYIILGIILERISGKKALDFLTQNFLTPLGLDSTYMAGVEPYAGLTSIPGTMAVGYENVLGSWIKSSTYVSPEAVAVYSSTWTCGNMVSTAADMAKWIRHYYNLQHGYGYLAGKYLSPASISSSYFTEKNFGFGIEQVRHISGCKLWGHTGTIIGFNSLVFYIPSKDISLAVLINDHRSERWKILHVLMGYLLSLD
ncbi:MAG TPA: serine hydrolase domain-containing protein [Spirochaetota bacterium]|nr:serine hydrolase domain-containing protein [Spirochaetota bacterium]HPV43441.1 serine hydrolase domain-containing protein [Spirochaetota bacterium]